MFPACFHWRCSLFNTRHKYLNRMMKQNESNILFKWKCSKVFIRVIMLTPWWPLWLANDANSSNAYLCTFNHWVPQERIRIVPWLNSSIIKMSYKYSLCMCYHLVIQNPIFFVCCYQTETCFWVLNMYNNTFKHFHLL